MIDQARIEAAIQDACLDVFDGGPPGPMLYKRLRRGIEARLRRFVRGRFTIEVGEGSLPEEVAVAVTVQTQRRVEQVSVQMTAL